ncbi:pentapeptide repeat-containing protein [Nonomuraea sp. M3C6]|uniref:Pentapeptide repeat-containing protein n=1 Tax=Nonomuraea marmarensis TaxID=3351344 RepID=A0ABW7AYK9_9ACTN
MTLLCIIATVGTATIHLLAAVPVPEWWEPIYKILPEYLLPPISPGNAPLVFLTILGVLAIPIGSRHFLLSHVPKTSPGRLRRLTESEINSLTPKERADIITATRATRLQLISAWGIMLGLTFTAGGLIYTARTLETTQEGQITDRYTKAVEQLASLAPDVRLGAIYALERIGLDSPRDRETIVNLLTTYVRNRDFCTSRPDQKTLPRQCVAKTLNELLKIPLVPLSPDVVAAWESAQTLRRRTGLGYELVDLANVRFPRADLSHALLSRVDLRGADLRGSRLVKALITDSNLEGADLRGADLSNIDARVDDLEDAWFGDGGGKGVSFSLADLRGANLQWARLNNVFFFGADLRGANLSGAWLTGVDLSSAKLAGVIGYSRKEIQTEAKVDNDTLFD